MRERENWDVLCEECDKTIKCGVQQNLVIITVTRVTTNWHMRTKLNEFEFYKKSGGWIKYL